MKGHDGAELSVRAMVLGVLLSVVLSAANAYLGLFAGMTVSASIPAAVVSMAVLRGLGGTLLENNIVQTAASAGESAAAGAIFTLPALLLLGVASELDYVSSTLLVGTGGVLGVLFTIPLRRTLVPTLPFPEGVATAEVLTAGHSTQKGRGAMRGLVTGAAFGAITKFLAGGLHWARESVRAGFFIGEAAFSLGASLSPALAAVGAIVGLPISLLMLGGGLVNWLVVVPAASDLAAGSAVEAATQAWATKTRYLGVGAMAFGGLWTLIQLREPLLGALGSRSRSLLDAAGDRDLPRALLLSILLVSAVVIYFVLLGIVASAFLALLLLVLVLTLGFLFCGVAAHMAGLVGSSNNPVSGVTIATILTTSAMLLLLGQWMDAANQAGAAGAILVGTMVCTAAAIGGDNMQDLKAGQLLGARPARQQVAQLVGVVAAALVLTPVLNLLASAYGFGPPSPERPHSLGAPQATLMAAVAQGVFAGGLPWKFVVGGAGLALVTAVLDAHLRARGSSVRLPVLALAVGIYLPVELTLSMALGALVCALVRGSERGRLLISAGLITGEALMGIGLAVSVATGVHLGASGPGGLADSLPLGLALFALSLWLLCASTAARGVGSARAR